MVRSLKRALQLDNFPRPAWLPPSALPGAVGLLWAGAALLWAGPGAFAWAAQHLAYVGGLALAATALWLVPGLALLRWLWPGRLNPAVRMTLALCAGVGLPPVALLLAHLARLPWNAWTTFGYVTLALAALLYRAGPWRARWRQAARRGRTWTVFWLVGLALLAVMGRLYLVRDLPAGLWGDSYQHTLMAQLLVDNAGLFTSWQPYAPLATFTYHFGFHANAALLHWLTGLPITQCVVAVGQLLSAATPAAAFALTAYLSRSTAAGLWAALLVGFINVQPGFYFNWGRYTQLDGQVLLTAVLAAWLRALEGPPVWSRRAGRGLLLAGLLTAGLFLSHYIVSVFAALFLGLYGLARLARRPAWAELRQVALGAALIGLMAAVVAAPWLANTLSGYLVRNASGFVNGGVDAGRIAGYATLPPIPAEMVKPYILALAALGLFVAAARRQWRVALAAGWALLLLLAVTPQLVGLPGAGVIDNFVVYIALYLPLGPLAGYALAEGQRLVGRRLPGLARAGAGAALLAGSVWGLAWQNQHLYDSAYQLFTPADAQAFAWIEANTAPEARFFVNTFPAYGGTLIAGSDGGWWLPLLAQRATNLPPLTYGSERGEQADYSRQVNALAVAVRGRPLSDGAPIALDLTTPDNYARLTAAGYGYVYLGAHANPAAGSADHIDAAALQARPDLFELVYAEAGAQIFRLRAAP
ncbi:MAG: hypothetical protein IT317_09255 [Anaerolineales bacterium]|nr:hypothetical protein [Anaerolineales bacterium]